MTEEEKKFFSDNQHTVAKYFIVCGSIIFLIVCGYVKDFKYSTKDHTVEFNTNKDSAKAKNQSIDTVNQSTVTSNLPKVDTDSIAEEEEVTVQATPSETQPNNFFEGDWEVIFYKTKCKEEKYSLHFSFTIKTDENDILGNGLKIKERDINDKELIYSKSPRATLIGKIKGKTIKFDMTETSFHDQMFHTQIDIDRIKKSENIMTGIFKSTDCTGFVKFEKKIE